MKTMGLVKAASFDNEATCLSSGCYSASLQLSGKDSQLSTAAAISACNVFLAPLRLTQLFCVKSAVMTNVVTTSNDVVPVFPAKPCYSVCERQPHINFNANLSEALGKGWFGAYYAITPMIYGLDLSGASQAYYNRYLPGVLKGAEGLGAVTAGTMFWDYNQTVSICVPVQNYGISTTTRSLSANDKMDHEEKQKGYFRENSPQLQAQSAIPPSCFSIILSMLDYKGVLNPSFAYANSWTIPEGKDYFSGRQNHFSLRFQFFLFLMQGNNHDLILCSKLWLKLIHSIYLEVSVSIHLSLSTI